MKLVLLILLFSSLVFGQDDQALKTKNLETTPRLLFQPLTANPYESRVGTTYQASDDRLRLDIGASIDLIRFGNDNNKISIGTDFMTYTRLRSEGNLKFPVETSDYFFGINTAWQYFDYKIRLRVAHISSHLVDGYADSTIFRKRPFVYSREFADLVATYEYKYDSNLMLRPYLGFNYIFSTQPKDVTTLVPQLGFDFDYKLSSYFSVIGGYDLKFHKDSRISQGANSLQFGILHKTSNNNGIFLGYYGYYGPSMHGMFYRDYDSYSGVGFQVYFY
jgi:hypothetical protein